MEIGKYIIDEELSLKDMYNLQEMNISVESLGLPKRVNNALKSAGIDNFSKLTNIKIK